MKTCRQCGELKPLTEFYRKNSNVDGYDGICKMCYRTRYVRHERKPLICAGCGKALNTIRRKFCPECAEKSKQEAVKKAKNISITNDPLRAASLCGHSDCKYYAENTKSCDYRLRTGRRRDSSNAEQCAQYVVGKMRNNWNTLFAYEPEFMVNACTNDLIEKIGRKKVIE